MKIDNDRDELLSKMGKETLKDRYLLPGESYQGMFKRVSKEFSDNEEHAQRLYDYMSQHWFMPATPILANGGAGRGQVISCFLQRVSDTMEDIVENWKETSLLSAQGGGIGIHYGDVRALGERVGLNGEAGGVIPFIKVNDVLATAISQGNLRRGSAATFLPVSHAEIEEFIEIRKPSGGDSNRKALNIHHGVVIDDKFMQAVEANGTYDLLSSVDSSVIKTIKARELWIKIVTTRLETGEPYIVWGDRLAEAAPEHHKKVGLLPVQSNLCVAPETKILTKRGYREISSLKGEKVDAWNGVEWSKVKIKKTGRNRPLIRVTFSDGANLECTPQHKFYIKNEYDSDAKKIDASELTIGDKLEKWGLPEDVHFEDWFTTHKENVNPDVAYSQGFFAGDGNVGLNYNWLYEEKYACKSKLIGTFSEQHQSSRRKTWKHGDMRDRSFVPHNKYGRSYCINWLAGLLDADGTVVKSVKGDTLQLASVDRSFLLELKSLLETMGVHSKISLAREAGDFKLPNGKGGMAFYKCKQVNRILIATAGTKRLLGLGLDCMRLSFNATQKPQRDAQRFIKVTSVVDLGRISDTYCATELKRGRLCFNGVVTGNCSEITLPTNKERTAVCCLSSLNLEYWDAWKDNELFIDDIMRFLDNVLQKFIDTAPDSMKKAVYSATNERSVGLGAMGFHSYLQSKNIPIDSVLAKSFNMRCFKHIKSQVDKSNGSIAKERGACPDAAANGDMLRFSYTMAIAPNASISTITGSTSPGIEPFNSNVYSHKTLSGTFTIKNKHLRKIINDKYPEESEKVWEDIMNSEGGSIQELDWFTKEEKEVFKTAFELDQRWLIGHAVDRQPFIDQAQSLNLFLLANVSKAILSKLHMEAWKKGLKTLYYLRSLSTQRAERLKIIPSNKDECLSCN